MLERTTDLSFMWSRGYSDYHPENPGGHAVGRTIEANPFDAASLGEERGNLRPTGLEAPVPMPITSADYRWMNLVAKKPTKGIPKIAQRVIQGIGGKVIGREYIAGGEALAAGLFGGLIKAGIPVWTEAALDELIVDGRSEEHTSELQSRFDIVCRLLLEKKKKIIIIIDCVDTYTIA